MFIQRKYNWDKPNAIVEVFAQSDDEYFDIRFRVYCRTKHSPTTITFYNDYVMVDYLGKIKMMVYTQMIDLGFPVRCYSPYFSGNDLRSYQSFDNDVEIILQETNGDFYMCP